MKHKMKKFQVHWIDTYDVSHVNIISAYDAIDAAEKVRRSHKTFKYNIDSSLW